MQIIECPWNDIQVYSYSKPIDCVKVQSLSLPYRFIACRQVHGAEVINVNEQSQDITADALVTDCNYLGLMIRTADCLPILLTDGVRIAAIHAGWRSLAQGIIRNALQYFADMNKVNAWLGPRICANCFEVGDDVVTAFCDQMPSLSAAFSKNTNNKYQADLVAIAIAMLGLAPTQLIISPDCTACNLDKYYSYRKNKDIARLGHVIIKSTSPL